MLWFFLYLFYFVSHSSIWLIVFIHYIVNNYFFMKKVSWPFAAFFEFSIKIKHKKFTTLFKHQLMFSFTWRSVVVRQWCWKTRAIYCVWSTFIKFCAKIMESFSRFFFFKKELIPTGPWLCRRDWNFYLFLKGPVIIPEKKGSHKSDTLIAFQTRPIPAIIERISSGWREDRKRGMVEKPEIVIPTLV